MAEQGARPERVRAFLGPAAASGPLPGRRRRPPRPVGRPAAGGPLDPVVARPDGPGHWLVDLVAANRQQLLVAGVPRRPHLRLRCHHGRRGLLQRPGPTALREVRPDGAVARLTPATRRVRHSMGRPGRPGPHLRCLPRPVPLRRLRHRSGELGPHLRLLDRDAHLHRALHVRDGRRLGRPGGPGSRAPLVPPGGRLVLQDHGRPADRSGRPADDAGRARLPHAATTCTVWPSSPTATASTCAACASTAPTRRRRRPCPTTPNRAGR